jgi:hypothetical protein
MVLNEKERGALEKLIDYAVAMNVPAWLPYFRNEENKKRMQYQNGDDVVFGFIWGAVMGSYLPTLMPRLMSGTLNMEDLDEVKSIVYNRSDEIRQKIYESG